MKLYTKDMYFLGETEEQQEYDCCVHGSVVFKIGNDILHEGGDWCVSASALRFMKTIFENRIMTDEDFLIPCCGNYMIPSDDKKSVTIIGCNNGIDFEIIHNQNIVNIKTQNGNQYEIPLDDYRNAVLAYAEQIGDFYKSNPPRKFYDDSEKDAYDAFMYEWETLYNKAKA